MPRTIDEGFRDFLTKLRSSGAESDGAQKHRASIKACLENNFGLRRFTRIGSFGNGTSISGYSDVDYLASLPRDRLTSNSMYSRRRPRGQLITSKGYNLSSDGTCNFNSTGDPNNTDPKLGTFGHNGRPTETIPLLSGSPAIDAGKPRLHLRDSACRPPPPADSLLS